MKLEKVIVNETAPKFVLSYEERENRCTRQIQGRAAVRNLAIPATNLQRRRGRIRNRKGSRILGSIKTELRPDILVCAHEKPSGRIKVLLTPLSISIREFEPPIGAHHAPCTPSSVFCAEHGHHAGNFMVIARSPTSLPNSL